jgi:hypothetical protein
VTLFGRRPGDWVAVVVGVVPGAAAGGVIFAVIAWPAVMVTGGIPIWVAVGFVAVMLVVVRLVWVRGGSVRVRGFVLALAAGSTFVMAVAVLATYTRGADPEEVEARLGQIASTTDTPVWYLGRSFHGWDLSYVAVMSGEGEVVGDYTLDPGQDLGIFYGETCSGGYESTCSWKLEIVIDELPSTGEVRLCLNGLVGDELAEAEKALRPVNQSAAATTPPKSRRIVGVC